MLTNGSTSATVTTGHSNFLGGTGISTNLNAGAITITNDSPNIVQNVLQSVSGDTGSYTAVASNSGFTIAGGTGITTAVSSNTLTITNTASFPSASENDNLVYDGSAWIATESPTISFIITSNAKLLVIDLMVVVYQLDLTILQYMSIEDLLIDLITQQEDHIHLKLMYPKMICSQWC